MKKGFTLVELLATITILGIIALLLVPTVVGTINGFKEDAAEDQEKSIIAAAKLWVSDHRLQLPVVDDHSICVTIEELKKGYLEGDLRDPKTKKLISNQAGVEITKTGKTFTYQYTSSCSGSSTSEDEGHIQLELSSKNPTSSSFTVVAKATVQNDTIKGYRFSLNDGSWSPIQTSSTKVFTGLMRNKDYTVNVRAVATSGEVTEKSIVVKTSDIRVPTYQVKNNTDGTKTVTITYDDKKASNFIYEYSTNGGSSWSVVTGTKISRTFETDTTLVARVRDTGNENNTVTASALTLTDFITTYQVKHYLMKTDGKTYELKKTETFNAKINSSVTPKLMSYTGFTAPKTQTVTVKKGGATVVSYYYTRNQYQIKLNDNYMTNNLMTKSYDVNYWDSFYATSYKTSTVKNLDANSGKELRFTMSTNKDVRLGYGGVNAIPDNRRLTIGKTYTYSIVIKTTRPLKMQVGAEQQYIVPTVDVNTSWQKITHTFVASERHDGFDYHTYIIYSNSFSNPSQGGLNNDTFYVHSVELAEGNGPKVTNLTKYYGQSLPNPSARSGYTFVGWYTEPVGGTKVTYAQANQTYYAHWRYNG